MKPILVIMAAGMGSRFGGLKQMTPVDQAGQVILDYSVYDAVRAGFQKAVCVIKKEIEADFRAQVGDRMAARCDLHYAFQALDDLP
ncbi:MAG: NTP transferase domain-containing protein, partial [Oscillospiraceae bacterium]|nr:NTP transferase domain-containing protein [Oscillospiraceae bacterium]